MAANMFVFIKGLVGDATEENHIGWIPVKSVSWSVERAVDLSDLGSTQRGYANVNFGKIAVTSELHKLSADLMLLASNGEPRTMAVSQLRVADNLELAAERYLRWTLFMGQVSKYEVSASEDGVPEETWEMAYRKLKVSHKLVDPSTQKFTGDEKQFGWNLETGKYDYFSDDLALQEAQ
jgi:type VI secretion system secreted protein Hcp